MQDNNQPVASVPSAPVATEMTAFQLITTTVRDAIQASGPAIRERYINQQVEAEIARRLPLLSNLIGTVVKAKQIVARTKPDFETFDSEGKSLGASFTKQALEVRKKITEKINKAEKVLVEALNDNQYGNVEAVTKELNSVLPGKPADKGEKPESDAKPE